MLNDKENNIIDMSWYNTQHLFTRKLIMRYSKSIAKYQYSIPSVLSSYLMGIPHAYIKFYYLENKHTIVNLIKYIYSASFAFTGKGEKLYVTQSNIKQALSFIKKIYLYLPIYKKKNNFDTEMLEQIHTSVSEHPNIFTTLNSASKAKLLSVLYKFAINISKKLNLSYISKFLKQGTGYLKAINDFKKLNNKNILSEEEKTLLKHFIRNLMEMKRLLLLENRWMEKISSYSEFSARYITAVSIYKILLKQKFISKKHHLPDLWFSCGNGEDISSMVSFNIVKNIINIESYCINNDIKIYELLSHMNFLCNKQNFLSLEEKVLSYGRYNIVLKILYYIFSKVMKYIKRIFTPKSTEEENTSLLLERKIKIINLKSEK